MTTPLTHEEREAIKARDGGKSPDNIGHYYNDRRALLADLEAAERRVGELEKALRDTLDILAKRPGGATHWCGCEEVHPVCAATKRLRTALAKGM